MPGWSRDSQVTSNTIRLNCTIKKCVIMISTIILVRGKKYSFLVCQKDTKISWLIELVAAEARVQVNMFALYHRQPNSLTWKAWDHCLAPSWLRSRAICTLSTHSPTSDNSPLYKINTIRCCTITAVTPSAQLPFWTKDSSALRRLHKKNTAGRSPKLVITTGRSPSTAGQGIALFFLRSVFGVNAL